MSNTLIKFVVGLKDHLKTSRSNYIIEDEHWPETDSDCGIYTTTDVDHRLLLQEIDSFAKRFSSTQSSKEELS